jgi:hypothetical protein
MYFPTLCVQVFRDAELVKLVCVKHHKVFQDRSLFYPPLSETMKRVLSSGMTFAKCVSNEMSIEQNLYTISGGSDSCDWWPANEWGMPTCIVVYCQSVQQNQSDEIKGRILQQLT